MVRLRMKNFNMILIEKLQKFLQEYLTGEEILPSYPRKIIEQVKFNYSPLDKAFEKQTKKIEYPEKKIY